jgi:hypothetical protein
MIEVSGSDIIIKRISSLLQFTAADGFKTSFDVLSTAECDTLQCLFDFVSKKFKPDIGMWIEARLKMLGTICCRRQNYYSTLFDELRRVGKKAVNWYAVRAEEQNHHADNTRRSVVVCNKRIIFRGIWRDDAAVHIYGK